jgi:hypothetical protein
MNKAVFLIFFIAASAGAQVSPHGEIAIPCEACHSADSWKLRAEPSFNHDSTGFSLQGRHRVIACASCHSALVFAGKRPVCSSCHADVHQSEVGTECLRCHTMESWIISDMKQKHQQTRFPLLGNHALADCDACHTRASSHRYAGTPLACIGCHRSEFESTTSPNHTAQGFPIDCSRCHAVVAAAWPAKVDHDLTSFPLTGAHRTVLCTQCHINNQFKKIASDCYSCHAQKFAQAQSPNHVAGGFSHTCVSCHTTTAWSPATFDHSATGFPLTGKHTTTQCAACHTGGNYQITYSNCYQCHAREYQAQTNPNHVSQNFSHACEPCHTTAGWTPATFDHTATRFPLTGKHTTTLCAGCHTNGNYQITYVDCYQCHQTEFQAQTNPNHVSQNFSHACEPCHTTAGWTPATFDHSTTQFPLTGTHITTQCVACHTNGNYQITFTECYQCHQTDFQRPTNPDHVAPGFSHDCTPCHTTIAWIPSTFNHDGRYFSIYSGTHQGRWTLCTDCHQNKSNFADFTCTTCHGQATTDSHHTSVSGYVYSSPACYSCHPTGNGR